MGSTPLLYELTEDTRFGFNYRSPANVNLSGDFDRPQPTDRFDSKFDLAQGFNLGAFHQLTPKVALLGDVGWTDWSTFDYQGFSVGGEGGSIPRNFKDTWRLGVGAQYQPGDTWTFSGGFSYDSSPVDAKDRLPDMPVSEQYRFSAGVLRRAAENIELGLGYTFLWAANNEIKGATLADGVVLYGNYDSYVHLISVSIGIKFDSLLGYT